MSNALSICSLVTQFLVVVVRGAPMAFMRSSILARCSGDIWARTSGGIGGVPELSLVLVLSHWPVLTASGTESAAQAAAHASNKKAIATFVMMGNSLVEDIAFRIHQEWGKTF